LLELGIRRDLGYASVNEIITVCLGGQSLATCQKLIWFGRNTLTGPLVRLRILVIVRLTRLAIPTYSTAMKANEEVLAKSNLAGRFGGSIRMVQTPVCWKLEIGNLLDFWNTALMHWIY